MNDNNTKIRQQIADKIKSSANILVTVGRNPSVDDLSAAIGLSALINKLDKHATTIFSGTIPPAITFLDPTKVFENNVNSLRDFIIALDKEKADHLRYKVDGDVVKIFITPYRTTITSNDLQFSQGDFNVDLVIALDVSNQEHIDEAIESNGSMLQNVTIATLTAGSQTSQLGTLMLHDDNASSLSEMIVGFNDLLKIDKTLLDKQISTALLTGIVSATDRFSNEKTTAQVMGVAAQLMAAGADQQLIAAKLQESHEITSLKYNPIISKNGEPITTAPTPVVKVAETKPSDGSLAIKHEDMPIQPEIIHNAEPVSVPPTPVIKPAPVVPPVLKPVSEPEITPKTAIKSESAIPVSSATPALGGSLSATVEQAEEDARREIEDQKNKVILSHSYLGEQDPKTASLINSTSQKDAEDAPIDIFSQSGLEGTPQENHEDYGLVPPQVATINPISADIVAQPLTPTPVSGLPLPPPVPDFSTLPPEAPAPVVASPEHPTSPFFSTLPPITPPTIPDVVSQPQTVANISTLPPQPTINDPSQFKIPS